MPEVECGFAGRPESLVRFGPTLQVQIGFDPSYRPESGDNPRLPETLRLSIT